MEGLEPRVRAVADVAWRVAVITLAYTVLSLPISLGEAAKTHTPPAAALVISVVSGATYALVMLPLVRRLPYRGRIRFGVVFTLLYVVGALSNLVEARFYTTMASSQLIGAAVIEGIVFAATSAMIVWLLRPAEAVETARPISEVLARRRRLSWAWRILLAGVLFAIVLNLSGNAWGPVIARYYHDPAFMAQTGTITQPSYISWPEETLRGILFTLVLLPVLAVMPGRDWRSLLRVGAYIALLDAAIEGWLPMLGQTSYPLQFRLGEGGGDLTTDAVVRGVFIALLLALPAAQAHRQASAEAAPARA